MLFISACSFAQSNKEDVDMIQAMFGKEKKELVKVYMAIPEAQAQAFWTVYDQYETERKAYGKKRIALLEEYASKYGNIDDTQATGMMDKKIALYNEFGKLQKKYFGKTSKVIGGKNAAKLFQIEDYFENSLRLAIQENIPFIDELDNTLLKK